METAVFGSGRQDLGLGAGRRPRLLPALQHCLSKKFGACFSLTWPAIDDLLWRLPGASLHSFRRTLAVAVYLDEKGEGWCEKHIVLINRHFGWKGDSVLAGRALALVGRAILDDCGNPQPFEKSEAAAGGGILRDKEQDRGGDLFFFLRAYAEARKILRSASAIADSYTNALCPSEVERARKFEERATATFPISISVEWTRGDDVSNSNFDLGGDDVSNFNFGRGDDDASNFDLGGDDDDVAEGKPPATLAATLSQKVLRRRRRDDDDDETRPLSPLEAGFLLRLPVCLVQGGAGGSPPPGVLRASRSSGSRCPPAPPGVPPRLLREALTETVRALGMKIGSTSCTPKTNKKGLVAYGARPQSQTVQHAHFFPSSLRSARFFGVEAPPRRRLDGLSVDAGAGLGVGRPRWFWGITGGHCSRKAAAQVDCSGGCPGRRSRLRRRAGGSRRKSAITASP